MKIISGHSALSETMSEEETKKFLANNNKNLLMRIGTIDEKGEPNVTVTGFHFDEQLEKIYLSTSKNSKKVQHLKNKNIIGYCIDDPNTPYKGVRGKGTVKFLDTLQAVRTRLLDEIKALMARFLLDLHSTFHLFHHLQ
jgi:uncharacterized pyridoxamine 5'-phosphate oxidase family protein